MGPELLLTEVGNIFPVQSRTYCDQLHGRSRLLSHWHQMFTLLTIEYTFFESCVKAGLVLNLCTMCVKSS